MVSDAPAGSQRRDPYHWTQVVNIKRDPFETSVGSWAKTLFGMAVPSLDHSPPMSMTGNVCHGS